jgi:hypothetical protein
MRYVAEHGLRPGDCLLTEAELARNALLSATAIARSGPGIPRRPLQGRARHFVKLKPEPAKRACS